MIRMNKNNLTHLTGWEKDIDKDVMLMLNMAVFDAKWCHTPNDIVFEGDKFNVWCDEAGILYFKHADTGEVKSLELKSLGENLKGTSGLWANIQYELRCMMPAYENWKPNYSRG